MLPEVVSAWIRSLAYCEPANHVFVHSEIEIVLALVDQIEVSIRLMLAILKIHNALH